MDALVTIIMPIYESQNYIKNSIVSIIKQTYQNIELVLVSDGCTDNSIHIAKEELRNTNINYRIIVQENRGVSSARNNGINQANGEYVMAVDSDDMLLPNTIEAMLNAAVTNNVDAVFCDYETVNNEWRMGQNDCEEAIVEKQTGENACENYYYRRMHYIAPALLVKKKFLCKNNILYDEECRFAEDDLYVWTVLAQIESLAYCRNKFYKYVVHNNSVMTSSKYEKYITSYLSAKKIENKIVQSANAKKVAICFLQRHVFGTIHAASKVLNYHSFNELISDTEFLDRKISHISKTDFPLYGMITIAKISPKIFYYLCKKH